MIHFRHGLTQLGISVDQALACFICFGSADTWADETLSAKCYRKRNKKRWHIAMKIVDVLFLYQNWLHNHEEKSHCKRAFISELERKQNAREYRT